MNALDQLKLFLESIRRNGETITAFEEFRIAYFDESRTEYEIMDLESENYTLINWDFIYSVYPKKEISDLFLAITPKTNVNLIIPLTIPLIKEKTELKFYKYNTLLSVDFAIHRGEVIACSYMTRLVLEFSLSFRENDMPKTIQEIQDKITFIPMQTIPK